jgi:hypothetical protein
MADSTTIAIVSIGATAFVAVVTPAVTHLFARSRDSAMRTHELEKQHRDLTAERSRADVDELRLLLDEVAQRITRALERYREVRSYFLQLGATLNDPAREAVRRFDEAGRDVDVDTQRVAIRLGVDHPLCEAHKRIAQAIVDAVQHVGVAASMGEHADVAETWRIVTTAGEDIYAARDQFTAEAVRLVGSRVEA